LQRIGKDGSAKKGCWLDELEKASLDSGAPLLRADGAMPPPARAQNDSKGSKRHQTNSNLLILWRKQMKRRDG
jgi:hypothetical protein